MKCSKCSKAAQHSCSVCGQPVCVGDSAVSIVCKRHIRPKAIKGKLKIRPARKSDEEALEDLEDSVIWEHSESSEYEDYDEKAWKNLRKETIVAEVGGEIVGFVEYVMGLDPHESPSVTVSDFAVLPEYSGMGIGTALIGEVKKVAKKMGFSTVYSSITIDNIQALIFHLKNGAKIFSVKDTGSKGKGRWGIPTEYSLAFVYKL